LPLRAAAPKWNALDDLNARAHSTLFPEFVPVEQKLGRVRGAYRPPPSCTWRRSRSSR